MLTLTNKKDSHKLSIVKQLYQYGDLASIDIANKTGKSLSLTTNFLLELLEDGIIEEAGFAPSSGGRKALRFKICAQNLYVIAVAMDQYITKIVLMDLSNRDIIAQESEFINLSIDHSSLIHLGKFIQKFIQKLTVSKQKIVGIGIGMPGFIDIKNDHNLTFLGENIGQYISKVCGIPAFIDNDSTCIALAEQYFGYAQDIQTAMVINISWGIGLGMILNGAIFRGENGFAGEFSHIPIFKNGTLCKCGKVGCLETETSLIYIIDKIKADIAQGRPSSLSKKFAQQRDLESEYKDFIAAAIQGDFLTIESISKAAYKIGQGIAILIHIINPKKIILSGRGASAGDIWLATIQQALNELCINKLMKEAKVVVSQLGIHAELIGASTLVIENIEHTNILPK